MDTSKNIIGIGLSGLVGTRIQEVLKEYSFSAFSTEQGIDITKSDSLKEIEEHPASKVLLLAAKADVDGCEADKSLGENGPAWMINVLGAQNIVDVCKKTNKKLYYISTDFVFNGDDTPEGGYVEQSKPDPINWYGRTKYEAEKIVSDSGLDHTIIRLAYPYRAVFEGKKDFFRAIRDRLKDGQGVKAISDHYFSATFLDDFASALGVLFQRNESGTFHVVGTERITPYDAAILIAEKYNLDSSLIAKTTREEYFQGKAARPFDLHLNNDKIRKLGCEMRSFSDGLDSILDQEKI